MLLQEQLLKLPLLTSGKYVEGLNLIEPSANLQAGAGDLSFPSNTKGGEGDPGRPTMIMCVPDMQLTGKLCRCILNTDPPITIGKYVFDKIVHYMVYHMIITMQKS